MLADGQLHGGSFDAKKPSERGRAINQKYKIVPEQAKRESASNVQELSRLLHEAVRPSVLPSKECSV